MFQNENVRLCTTDEGFGSHLLAGAIQRTRHYREVTKRLNSSPRVLQWIPRQLGRGTRAIKPSSSGKLPPQDGRVGK